MATNRSSSPNAWLRQIPITFGLFSGAAAALLGVFAPDRFIPEPLHSYRVFATVMVLVALVASWAAREWLVTHPFPIAGIAVGLFFALMLFRLVFVREVQFLGPPPESEFYVIGTQVVQRDLTGWNDEDVIKQVGGTWSGLRYAWGNGFVAAAIGYALLYSLFVQAFVMGIGAITLPKQRPAGKAAAKSGRQVTK